jgi:hypothetical protein
MLCIWQLIFLNILVPELMFPSLKMIMANKVDTSASSSYYALLITVLVFVIVGTCCAEERSVLGLNGRRASGISWKPFIS